MVGERSSEEQRTHRDLKRVYKIAVGEQLDCVAWGMTGGDTKGAASGKAHAEARAMFAWLISYG